MEFLLHKKRMQEMGLEPTRSCDHRHLKPARLPIPPLLHFVSSRSRDCLIIIPHFVLNVNSFFNFFYFFYFCCKSFYFLPRTRFCNAQLYLFLPRTRFCNARFHAGRRNILPN